jgi:hypothetical protein
MGTVAGTAVLMALLAPVVHELGHFLAALAFGKILKFRRRGFRFIWDMPEGLKPWQEKTVAGAGFAAEIIPALPLLCLLGFPYGVAYTAAASAHLLLYPKYAERGYSDFDWFF